ncbi:hypothetical protein Thiowin_03693 [Thiorhodovibrio winogradskyi]|uniref:SAM-dependent methyltransferase n=1 Tax=Thiorhodovibrio winogradskyi TaxID=77007 RepID=A0ABZ0SE72_9GAMM|nr:SAM-dependent methyltransferase [Thiorhodovibrio winogradskyi]
MVDQVSDSQALAHHQSLLALIRQRIDAAEGALSFDSFMELALYAPGLGYYVAGLPKLGPTGDFVTAPEISPLFAGCLAAQCSDVFTALGGGDLLEFGAGSGVLAADLLAELARQQRLPGQYLILEPSPDLQARQRATLAARVPGQAHRVRWLTALPSHFQGVVIANEVLDAMPVHRFCIDSQGAPEEVFVSFDEQDQALTEVTGPARSLGLQQAVLLLQSRGLALEPGYCSEINLRLAPWMRALARAMDRALVLLIDYGYPRKEYYHRQRGAGTLISHHQHRANTDPFQRLGLQDISAHVDFSAVADAGRAAGFDLAGYTNQANFLIGCGLDQRMMEALAAAADPALQMRISAGARQLVLPAAMGERFQVLGLARGFNHPCRGFAVRDLRGRL